MANIPLYRVANDIGDWRSPLWTDPLKFGEAIDLVKKRAVRVQGEGFRQKTRGDGDFGPVRDLTDSLAPYFRRRVSNGHVGDVHILWALKNDLHIMVREVAPTISLIPTPGNDHIDRLWTELVQRLGYTPENWGFCVRRFIDGTSTWSQHAPWPDGPGGTGANAVDIRARSYSEGDHIRNILVGMRTNGFPVGTVLWRVAGHYDHVHAEGAPKRTGSPLGSC